MGKTKQNIPAELTEAEWEIMKVVWEKEPCAAGTVQEELVSHKEWAYSTVKTMMDRMVKKGALTTTRIRNLNLFHSAISQDQAKAGEFRKMLKRAFDGALTPMMQFLVENEKLSKDEVEKLKELAEEAEKRVHHEGAKDAKR
jgi:BlaI family transcriptional regulator, penicillinase repressor